MSKRERGGVSSFQDALGEFLKTSGLGRHLEAFPVFEAWSTAVGEELAKQARPVRFQRGELIVEVESSVHMHELTSFTGEGYRLMANKILAEQAQLSSRQSKIHKVCFQLKR